MVEGNDTPMYEAIGLLELRSIAWGLDAADVMIKAAPVSFIDTFMVTPGKFVVLVHGDPSSVESSLQAGRDMAREQILDWLFIPFVDPQVFTAITLQSGRSHVDALGFVETATVATGIRSADAAAKAAEVTLLQLHLARGIGGKSLLTLTGSLPEVQAAVHAAEEILDTPGGMVATRIVANPHPDLAQQLLQAAHLDLDDDTDAS
jgi:microcompartment protein CcmL/EutN